MIERIQEADKELRMSIHRSTNEDTCSCPLCEGRMESMYGKQSPFHYWCEPCNHGWYIADLHSFSGMCIAGKRKEAIQIILKKDMEEEDESK